MEELQQLQNQYAQLCGQAKHHECQIWVAETQIEELNQAKGRTEVELKGIIKKIAELQRKAQFDAQKAAQQPVEEKKAS